MTQPPHHPGPPGPAGPYGQPGQPDPYGGFAGQPHGAQQPYGGQQYGAPYQPPGAGPFAGQQPSGGQPPGLGQPSGYPLPPTGPGSRRSVLPWVVVGGAVLVVALVVGVLLAVSGGDGSTGSPRATAQAYADAINDRKADRSLYCAAFLDRADEVSQDLPDGVPTDLPNLPSITMSATVTEVAQNGDRADAAVRVDTSFAGQKLSVTHELTIQKEAGAWKICDIDFGLAGDGGG